jgi:hypothetical protein
MPHQDHIGRANDASLCMSAYWQDFCSIKKLRTHAVRSYWHFFGDERQEGTRVNSCQQAQVLDVRSESFDQLVINSPIPVLVNFQTPWSKQMVPLLGQLAEAFAGRL